MLSLVLAPAAPATGAAAGKLAEQPAEGQPRPDFKGTGKCPFHALREAFRSMRAMYPGYAFGAVWEVIKAEDDFAGVPAYA